MSKKLVQINVVCNGSTGRIMTQIQQEAIKQGWEAYSFYGRGKPANENCIKVGNKLDVWFHVFITRFFDRHGYGSKRATKKMIKQIEEIDPDVIQLHNIHGYYLNMKVLFKYLKGCNKKIVWTLHDCWAFTGHCSYFTYPACCKWKKECSKCIRKKDYPKSIWTDNSKKAYEDKKKLFTGVNNLTIITPSNWLAQLVKESFLKEYNVKVINNGIDLSVFKPQTTKNVEQKYAISKDKEIILGVASIWDGRKGLETFIELSKMIDDSKVIVLVGLNKKQKKQLLKYKNIIGVMRTDNINELVELYNIATVFVNPTLEDNFPTTNLEAMACGTPIITFNTGGSPESISSKCGMVVEQGNVVKLYDAITKLKNDNLKSEDCVEKAKKYSGSDKYKEYMNLYMTQKFNN